MSAVIIGLDRAIKRVLAVAKPDTLVFFLTDNGRNLGSNNPLRGGKSDIYEGGIRVPFMAMQGGAVAAGQVRSVPVSVIDILPTVLKVVGASPTLDLDGRDILGTISADRPLVFSDIQRNGAAIRKDRWKLLKDYDGKHYQLYDIAADRSESNNLASTNQTVVGALDNEMTSIMSQW